jgi:flavin-dependent dehydrogenase
MGLAESILQTFDSLLVHTPRVTARWALPFTFSTFDYRRLCELLWEQAGEAEFDIAKVEGVRRPQVAGAGDRGAEAPFVVHTDRGDVSATHVVDALGWRRVLAAGENVQPPAARLSRGLEVHPSIDPDPPTPRHRELELWIDARYVSPGYSWSFPARDEVRVGVGSFDPRVHVKDPTLRLAADVDVPARSFQGNWIPHALRPATEDGVWFAGDSAGHCLPLTAEGIRTAFYFGIACGRELRAVVDEGKDERAARGDYHAFSARHARKWRALFASQQAIRHLHGAPMDALVRLFGRPRTSLWAFRHYLDLAPPAFALPAPPTARAGVGARTAA